MEILKCWFKYNYISSYYTSIKYNKENKNIPNTVDVLLGVGVVTGSGLLELIQGVELGAEGRELWSNVCCRCVGMGRLVSSGFLNDSRLRGGWGDGVVGLNIYMKIKIYDNDIKKW